MADPKLEDDLWIINQGLVAAIQALRSNFWLMNQPWLSEAAFTYLLINLSDVLRLLKDMECRIDFRDDLPEGLDVTDVVIQMRNAVCHIGSFQKRVDTLGNVLSFGVAIGGGTLAMFDDLELANPYSDDVAFFYGARRLLLKRHVWRAVELANYSAVGTADVHGIHWNAVL